MIKPNYPFSPQTSATLPGAPANGIKDEAGAVSVSEDEADGCTGKESDKIFKQLGFPVVESDKFNPPDFPKVAKCINKRVQKLGDLKKRLDTVTNPTDQQQSLLDV